MEEDDFDQVIDVNLKGVFDCTQAVIGAMLERGSGVVLNASSIVGLHGNFGQGNYAASKFGVIGLTEVLGPRVRAQGRARERGVPGLCGHRHGARHAAGGAGCDGGESWMRRLGQPDEIASVYAFLAGDEASFVNGAVIEVSGGVSL